MVSTILRKGKGMQSEIVEKLKRSRGYNDDRIGPYPNDPALWIAEFYIPGRTAKKTWKVMREEKRDVYRLFPSAEQAAHALEEWITRWSSG